jgi:MFS family permease
LEAPRRPGLRGVCADREFQGVLSSFILSAVGDRLALVALTLLVYDRTRSPLLAPLAYASATIPYLAGGLLLGGLADRLPRRSVMIGCDLVRAALTAVMILPGVPLSVLIAALYAVTVAQPPFDAARSAAVKDIFDGEAYFCATTILQVTFRLVLVAGAAAGGLAVALIGPRPVIAVDAATFLASALLIRLAVRSRPGTAARAAVPPGPRRGGGRVLIRGWAGGTADGVRLVWGSPVLRTVMLLGWLGAFYEVPEALAAPYAAAVGGGPVAAGLLLASGQAMILAAPWYMRLPNAARRRWMGPMAIAATALLTLTALRPGIAASMIIFALVGACGVYQITANIAFVEAAPEARRAQALGIAGSGLVAGQGIAFAAAGWAAEAVAPSTVTAVAGGVGALLAGLLTASWRRQAGQREVTFPKTYTGRSTP